VAATLVVSLSGARTETLDFAADLAAQLDARGVPLSLLVAPRLKHGYRLTRDGDAQAWLRARRDAGDALVLHGYDQAATKGRRAEFATLPEHEARLRLTAADRVVESLDLRTRSFAPPRWVASPGSVAVLPALGFRHLADLTGVRDLTTGAVVRSRVLGVGGGRRSEPWWCRALVLGAGRTARRGGLVRVSVDARHLGPGPRQAVLDAVDLALHHGARPATYGPDLLAPSTIAA
jgi:predicted deacetylase